MNTFRIIFCGLFLALLPAMAFCQEDINKEYYEIYKACLLDFNKDSSKVSFIEESAVYYPANINLKKPKKRFFSDDNSPPPVDTNFYSLLIKYQHPDTSYYSLRFMHKYDVTHKLTILSKKTINMVYDLAAKGQPFYKIFDNFNKLYSFSKIVLSENRNYAIVYIERCYSPNSRKGYLLLCKKINGKWIVKHAIDLCIN